MPLVGIGKTTHFVPLNMCSVSPEGHRVVYVDGKGFFQIVNGVTQQYSDENCGLVQWRDRQFIKTNATCFIRDGNEYFVYLPSEKVFLTRPAGAGDSHFKVFEFDNSGIWGPDSKRKLDVFGHSEWVASTRAIDGTDLLTRANGEILETRDGEVRPYDPDPQALGGQLVRVDLARTGPETADDILTIFYRLRHTLGATLWLDHFARTEDLCRQTGPRGHPFLRNSNVVFFAGEDDFRRCIDALADTVRVINASYKSLRPGAVAGKLATPTYDNVDSALLNELHYEFELFGDRLKSGDKSDVAAITNVYGPFCQLNDRVHACEGALANRFRTQEEAWWSAHCAFLPDFYSMLPQEVYREFTLDWSFGNLFMGYHTLGKDIIASFWNNDEALFERDEIRPQRISSAEIFAYFGPDTCGQHDDLRAWWRDKDLDAFGYTLDDPRNAIGYVPIGDVLFQGLSVPDFKRNLTGASSLVGMSLIPT